MRTYRIKTALSNLTWYSRFFKAQSLLAMVLFYSHFVHPSTAHAQMTPKQCAATPERIPASGKPECQPAYHDKTGIDSPLISRVWHGWTTKANADRFETLLKEEVFPGFAQKKMAGYRGVQLLRQDGKNEVEFTTIMWFDSIEAVKRFAGADYQKAHIDPAVRSLFTRFDTTVAHYEVRYASIQ
jgi:heme-degrading monooxygenase HmoA